MDIIGWALLGVVGAMVIALIFLFGWMRGFDSGSNIENWGTGWDSGWDSGWSRGFESGYICGLKKRAEGWEKLKEKDSEDA